MIGGIVVGIVRYSEEPTLLTVRGTGCEANDRLCVRIREGSALIALGDSVWWAGGEVHWRPAAGGRTVRLEKVGYSFVPEGTKVGR